MIREATSFRKVGQEIVFSSVMSAPLTSVLKGSSGKKTTSMSISATHLKFSPATCLAFSTARSKDWDDVLTGHAEHPCARSWSVLNKRVGNWEFDVVGKKKAGSVKVAA